MPALEPPELLRRALAEQRRSGAAFDEAWRRAVPRAVRFAGPPRERGDWTAALEATRDAWRRAYDGEPAERQDGAALVAA